MGVMTDKYPILETELEALQEEYDCGHFTACALRVGRALEYAVYTVALGWNVRVDDHVFDLVSSLDGNLKELNAAIFEYRDGEKDGPTRKRVHKLSSRMLEHVHRLGFVIDHPDELAPVEVASPRNVLGLLQDIKRAHSRSEQVRENIDQLTKEVVPAILEARNNAAHADSRGRPREVDKRTVDETLENLRIVLERLVRVGISIRHLRHEDAEDTMRELQDEPAGE